MKFEDFVIIECYQMLCQVTMFPDFFLKIRDLDRNQIKKTILFDYCFPLQNFYNRTSVVQTFPDYSFNP